MTKKEFLDKLAANCEIEKGKASKLFDGFVQTIEECLQSEGKTALTGFGTFELKVREAREAINPLTKEKIKIAKQNVPNFKFSKSFKEKFNK